MTKPTVKAMNEGQELKRAVEALEEAEKSLEYNKKRLEQVIATVNALRVRVVELRRACDV